MDNIECLPEENTQQVDAAPQKRRVGWRDFFVVCGVFAIVFGILAVATNMKSPQQKEEMRLMDIAKRIVVDSLASPTSAKFLTGPRFMYLDDGSILMTFSVDSSNAMGVMIRDKVEALAQPNYGTLEVTAVRVGGEDVFMRPSLEMVEKKKEADAKAKAEEEKARAYGEKLAAEIEQIKRDSAAEEQKRIEEAKPKPKPPVVNAERSGAVWSK